MRASIVLLLLGLLLIVVPVPALGAGDAEEGEALYRRCKACHALDAGERRLGPHLAGIVGRPAAAVEGYDYSNALANADLVWSRQHLDAFLADPKGFLAGTSMSFNGVRDAQDRADLIAYLAQQ